MRNVKKEQLKKCICMSFQEFNKLILDITNRLMEAAYELEGIYFNDTEKANRTGIYWNEDITETLSKYYNVKVTSIHADNYDDLGIWIVYKENE